MLMDAYQHHGWHFNPRSPRGLRQTSATLLNKVIDISIHAAQEGCDRKCEDVELVQVDISIHAAQEGCDEKFSHTVTAQHYISIHAAQEGCDDGAMNLWSLEGISIHAAQEGCDTGLDIHIPALVRYFNPRSPRGLRHRPGSAQDV